MDSLLVADPMSHVRGAECGSKYCTVQYEYILVLFRVLVPRTVRLAIIGIMMYSNGSALCEEGTRAEGVEVWVCLTTVLYCTTK